MKDERPIIIIKKPAKHAGHHGGAWKVAYADFVTAMMAFFLVMWIMGLNPDVRKLIADYFNDPSGFMKTHAGGVNVLSTNPDASRGKPSVMPSLESLLKRSQESAHFKMAKAALEKKIAAMPEFRQVRKYVEISITPEGLRIELLEAQERLFFETGSAKLQPHTVDLLGVIAKELGKLPNDIVIEGHTDAQPYSGGTTGYSNWELSADRANAARRVIEPRVHSRQIVEVRGYADHRLRNPEDPYHFSNRRISIVVRYSDISEKRASEPKDGTVQVGPGTPTPELSPEIDVKGQ